MSCDRLSPNLSAYLDGDLTGAEARAVSDHVAGCERCALVLRETEASLALLQSLPKTTPRESVAARVLDRLEMERRGPGLALLFRPYGAARPLMVPSLLHASFFLVLAFGLGIAFQRPPTGPTPWTQAGDHAWPEVVQVGRLRHADLAEALLADGNEGSLFLETRVARDGSVASVKLLDGDAMQAAPVIEALRRERFEPTRLRGLPVAVSVYRLVSLLEVLAPRT